MDEERKRRIASLGGLASAKGKNTANRGFASMDKDKQREISSMGGKAPRSTQGPREKNDQVADQHDIKSEEEASPGDPRPLNRKDRSEPSEMTREDLSASDTDENEDEGLGDGNLGRSTRGGVYGK